MTVPEAVSDRILASCLGRPVGYAALRDLCDEIGGRISGTDKGRQAEEWAAEHLRTLGLENVRFEDLDIAVWEREWLQAEVRGPRGWDLSAVAHGFAPATCDVTAPLVDAGFGMPADYERLGSPVRGAAVLCDEGAPEGQRVPHRTEKLAWAVRHEAAALLIASSAPGYLTRTGVCHRSGAPIPSMGLSQEDCARLRRSLENGGRLFVRVQMRNTIKPGTARNVLADLPGATLPQEMVILGAHLDSWDVSQGATDNGLGCAIVLQVAAALIGCGKRPRRTIRFAFWAAEETGLHGSRRYVETHERDLHQIVALMNFDMTGDPYGYWVPGLNGEHSLLRELANQLAPLGMTPTFRENVSLHSDHQPFLLEGVPVVGLAAKLPDGGGGHYYHSAGDTFEKVSRAALCRAAAVAAHTAWVLAECDQRPYRRLTGADVHALLDRAGLRDAIEAQT